VSLLGYGSTNYPQKNIFHTLIKVPLKLPLNPNRLTVFTSVEVSFIITNTRSENRAIVYEVCLPLALSLEVVGFPIISPIFSIQIPGNYLHLLIKVQSFFCVVNITPNQN
jgi:hypothetical protein